MAFIASKGYVHRDVAARNVLLAHDIVKVISYRFLLTTRTYLQVADFGLCEHVDNLKVNDEQITKIACK